MSADPPNSTNSPREVSDPPPSPLPLPPPPIPIPQNATNPEDEPTSTTTTTNTTGGEDQRVGVIEGLLSIGKAVKWVVKFVGAIVASLPAIVASIWAAFILALIIIIIIIIVILISKMNPRIPQIFHATDLDSQLSSIARDMELDLALLVGSDDDVANGTWMRDHPSLAAHYQSLQNALRFVTKTGNDTAMVSVYEGDPYSGDLQKSIRSYYIFYDSITKFNCISKSDLRNNMPEINDGEGSPDRAPFLTSFIRPMDNLREVVTRFSKRLYEIGDFTNLSPQPVMTNQNVKYATLIHELRMMLDQRPDITRMYTTRRPHLPMAIWTVYYVPLVVNMFTQRIPAYWMKFPRRYVSTLESALRGWLKIGAMIVAMPCYLAFPDPAERQKKCKSPENFEAFQPSSDFYQTFLGFTSS